MKRGIAVLVVLVLIVSATVVLAQRQNKPMMQPKMGSKDGWGMGMGMCEKMKKALNLTDDQVKQLEAIHKDFLDTTQATRDEIKSKMKQMMDLWMVDQPDPAAIKQLASEMQALRAQVRDAAIDHAVSAIAVLTPDQRAKVKDWLQKHPHMMMGMGGGVCCAAGMHCPMAADMGEGMGKGAGSGMGAGMGKGASSCCPCMK